MIILKPFCILDKLYFFSFVFSGLTVLYKLSPFIIPKSVSFLLISSIICDIIVLLSILFQQPKKKILAFSFSIATSIFVPPVFGNISSLNSSSISSLNSSAILSLNSLSILSLNFLSIPSIPVNGIFPIYNYKIKKLNNNILLY